jgi:Ca2+-transporting ATPase
VLAAYGWALARLAPAGARAFGFAVLVLADVGLIFSNRSRTRTSIESLATPNPIVWAVCVSACAVLALALFVPLLAELFYFGRLAPARLAAACAIGISSILWFDAFKLLRRGLRFLQPPAR